MVLVSLVGSLGFFRILLVASSGVWSVVIIVIFLNSSLYLIFSFLIDPTESAELYVRYVLDLLCWPYFSWPLSTNNCHTEFPHSSQHPREGGKVIHPHHTLLRITIWGVIQWEQVYSQWTSYFLNLDLQLLHTELICIKNMLLHNRLPRNFSLSSQAYSSSIFLFLIYP